MPTFSLPCRSLRWAFGLAVAPFLAWFGCPVAQARITLNLEPPAHTLPTGSVYTFIPTITGTQDRSHLEWELLENGRRIYPEGVLEPSLRASPSFGLACFFAPDGEVSRVFQVRVTSRLDPGASAEVTVQAEPKRPARLQEPAQPRYLWPLAHWSPELQNGRRWPRELGWDPGSGSLLVTDLFDPQWVRVHLACQGGETVASAEEPMTLNRTGFKVGPYFGTGAVAIHPQGGIVVADDRVHCILRVHKEVVTILAGTGAAGFNGDLSPAGQEWPATQAQINTPTGVVVTAQGEVVFSDTLNRRVRKITLRGTLVTLAGPKGPAEDAPPLVSGPGLRGGVNSPRSLALAPDGHIVFVDHGLIRAIDTQGGLHTLAGNGRYGFSSEDCEDALCAFLGEPQALAVASDGSLIFCVDDRVRMVTKDRRLVTLAGVRGGRTPGPGVFDLAANMIRDYKAWWYGIRFPVPANRNEFWGPISLCPLPGGSLLVLDQHNHGRRIQFLGPGGAGELALVNLIQKAWDCIKKRDRPEVDRILKSLDRWAQVPKAPAEKLRLGLVTLASDKSELAKNALPGIASDLQKSLLGDFLMGGEQEQGLAIQAQVASAFIRRAAATCNLAVRSPLNSTDF